MFQESELRFCQQLIDKESGGAIKKGRKGWRKVVEPGGPLQCKIESAESDTWKEELEGLVRSGSYSQSCLAVLE